MTRAYRREDDDHPTARTTRYRRGLQVGLMFFVQVGAALWAYSEWRHVRPGYPDEMRVCWHRFAEEAGIAGCHEETAYQV